MKKHFVRWLLLIFGAGFTLAYQNCKYESTYASAQSNQSEASSEATPPISEGGEGFDGKVYISQTLCGSSFGVKSTIVVSNDSKSAALTRENCQDLTAPKPVPVEELKFPEGEVSVFSYNNQVFDLQTDASSQRTTLHLCRSENAKPSVEILVWRHASSGSLYGSLTESDGSRSGPLEVLTPLPAAPLTYTTVAGQSSEFELVLSNESSGSLYYTLWREPQSFAPKMLCVAQPPPMAMVQEFAANVQGSGITWDFEIHSPTLSGNLLVIGLTRPSTIAGQAPLGCVIGIQDNAGNVFIKEAEALDPQSGTSEIWYAANSKAQGSIATITLSSATGCANRQPKVNFAEFLGVATVNPVESSAVLSNQPSSLFIKGPAITTSGANTLIISMANAQHELLRITAGNPFTFLGPGVMGDAGAYLFANSAGTYEAAWDPTYAGTYSSVSVSFKSAR